VKSRSAPGEAAFPAVDGILVDVHGEQDVASAFVTSLGKRGVKVESRPVYRRGAKLSLV
jgi:hypothetical protein